MRENTKKAWKPIKLQLNTLFLEYDYDFQFYPLQHNNIFQILLCAKFRGK